MSEEIENPSLNVPRAIVTTMIINGVTGYGMVLAILFSLGDIETVLVSDSSGVEGFCLMDVGFRYWIPFHSGLLRCYQIESWNHGDDSDCPRLIMVRCHWIPSCSISNDLVICSR